MSAQRNVKVLFTSFVVFKEKIMLLDVRLSDPF